MDQTDYWDLVTRIVVGGGIILVIAAVLLGRRVDFIISFSQGRLQVRGKFPKGKQNGLAQFLAEDLATRGPIKILGRWQKNGLRVWFKGRLRDGDRQRIRNYLSARL